MHLHRIKAKGFRAFGGTPASPSLDLTLNEGLNLLIGENDAGKTTIIDAIRLLLWTTSYENVRLQESDFHAQGTSQVDTLTIEACLKGLSVPQEAAVLEWLTYESDGTRSLILHLKATRIPVTPGKRARVFAVTHSGVGGAGPEIGAAVRELVRATYLRPLRDAEAELRPGRMSRLSQILGAHKSMVAQDRNDFDPAATDPPETLVGMMSRAQYDIQRHATIGVVQDDINSNYLSKMSFNGEELTSRIRIAGSSNLTQILERFELSLTPPTAVDQDAKCGRGLGYNNALFMATELVLLSGDDEGLPLLLIEEPEAHLHPQLQDRVLKLMQAKSGDVDSPVQVLMSTHSPSLATTAPLESLILVRKARTYPLRQADTRLDRLDYEYLERFLDATKANLFFARGVLVVEGPGEALLLPALAEAAGLSLSAHGVSIVNVGDVGLYHYARIFQRAEGAVSIGMPVACITDRDIVPTMASYVAVPKKKSVKRFEHDYDSAQAAAAVQKKVDRVQIASDDAVRVFVSDHWTLEYDLALSGCSELIFTAIALACIKRSQGERFDDSKIDEMVANAAAEWMILSAKHVGNPVALACEIYEPLYAGDASKAVTAQFAARLLASGKYGKGRDLLDRLPAYLRHALVHVTSLTDDASGVGRAGDAEPEHEGTAV